MEESAVDEEQNHDHPDFMVSVIINNIPEKFAVDQPLLVPLLELLSVSQMNNIAPTPIWMLMKLRRKNNFYSTWQNMLMTDIKSMKLYTTII